MSPLPLDTTVDKLFLVTPDIERDSKLSVTWLQGETGRNTLKMMGVAVKDNHPSTITTEKNRIQSFIERRDQLNWMIKYDGNVVGSTWVDLDASEYLKCPSVHIMIGDPDARSKGIGTASVKAVIKYLTANGYTDIYSRYLIENHGSALMLVRLHFKFDGNPYTDEDRLTFQNVHLHITQ